MNDFINTIETGTEHKRRHSIIYIIFVCFFCLIIASAQPLCVAATEVEEVEPIPRTVATIAGMLAGGAATYCVSAEIGLGAAIVAGAPLATIASGVIVVVLVGLGVSLAVGGIVLAINKAYEFGYFQDFVDKLVAGLNGGILKMQGSKLIMGASIFQYCVDWVKEHILKQYDEETPLTDISAAENGYELYVPQHVFENGRPDETTLYSTLNSTTGYYDYNYTVDTTNSSEGTQATYQANGTNFTNSKTKLKCSFNTPMVARVVPGGVTIDFQQTFHFDRKGKHISFSRHYSKFDSARFSSESNHSVSKFRFFLPYVYTDNNNNKYLDFYSRWYYTNTQNTQDWRLYVTMSNSNSDNSWYYRDNSGVDHKLEFDYGTKYLKDNQQRIYTLTFDDGTEKTKFENEYNFMYYVFCKSCTVNVLSSGQVVESELNADKEVKVSNPYYDKARDIFSNTANTIRSGVRDGTITDSSEGAISIGITEGADVNSKTDAELQTGSTPITAQAAITEYSATDVKTDVQTQTGTETVTTDASLLIDVPTAIMVAASNIKSAGGELQYKFPFDVIKAAATWLQALVTEGHPLVIDYDFTAFSHDFHVHIDFSRYQTLVTVGNWIVLVATAIGLLVCSKKALEAI